MTHTYVKDGRTFTFIISDYIINSVKKDFDDYEELDKRIDLGEDIPNDEGYLIRADSDNPATGAEVVREQFKYAQHCRAYIERFDPAKEFDSISKKKNGTFRKNGVTEVVSEHLYQLWEDSYCYAYNCLRWKSTGDTTAELQADHGKVTW